MNEPNEVYSKVPNENKTCTYIIKTVWEEDYFRLIIFEGTNSWFALVTKDNIKMLADQHELEPIIYFKNLYEYICCNHSHITFNIVKKQFVIFRNIENERLRIKYFFVNLEKLNYQETIESVVDDLLAKWAEMQAKLKILEEQKLEAENQKILYERKCEEFVDLKRKSDLQMYSAFALCLNEKKHQIRFLTELLDEYQTDRKQTCITALSSAKTNKATDINPILSESIKCEETVSDFESNLGDNYNTDDEKNENAGEQVSKINPALSTTIKCEETILDFESNSNDNYNTDDENNDNTDEQVPKINTVLSTTIKCEETILDFKSYPGDNYNADDADEEVPTLSINIKCEETISDFESNPSDNYNTDDEKNDDANEHVPGTSKDNLNFLGGYLPPPPSLPKRIISGTDSDETIPAVQNTISPPRKRAKKGHLSVEDKEMILNVYKCELQNNPEVLIANIVNIVSNKTGVSCASVYSVMREYKNSHTFAAPKTNKNRTKIFDTIDVFDRNTIRRIIHNFIFHNEVPTVDKIQKEINDNTDLLNCKRSTVYNFLKKLNFKYQRCGNNSMLLDKDEIIIWRRNYLKQIKQYRIENRKIYFLDETWVDAGHTKSHLCTDKTVKSGLKKPAGKGKRLIICHIGSDDGFVPNALWTFESKKATDYHKEKVGQSFEKWFSNVLLNLAENAVIVMDNAPYNSRKLEKIPTKATKKADIQNWLTSKAILFDNNMLKVELLDIVRKHKDQYNKYIVDEMAKSKNIIILRLPPYHCELNPIQLIWTEIKNKVARKNTTFKFADCKKLFYEAVQSISEESWQKSIQHVKENVEPKMWEIDNIIEINVEPLIINVNANDSSSESSE